MARLFHSGAEIDAGSSPAAANTGPDGQRAGSGTGNSRDLTVFRSGAGSWKFDSLASTFVYMNAPAVTFVDGNTYYLRGYFRAVAAPTTACAILVMDTGSTGVWARLRTDGAVELISGTSNAVQGSPSAAITDSNWHRVELKAVTAATTLWTASELLVDGVSVATWSGSVGRITSNVRWGWADTVSPGASQVINVDDVALNDSTGSVNNSYPGAGAVVLLKPTVDSAVGTGWTGGAGGTTNLWDAVNNTPPVGVADTGTDTSQIRNATSNANVNYDATMTTYTVAGVSAGATINAVIPWVATAAPVTTGSKAGTVGVVSNPAITNVNLGATGTAGAFWSGTTGGTYGAGWKWSPGTMTEQPSVTLGTAPVMRVTQVTASTRIADVCGMFIYVDYTPAAVAAAPIPDVGMALTVT